MKLISLGSVLCVLVLSNSVAWSGEPARESGPETSVTEESEEPQPPSDPVQEYEEKAL